MHPRLIAAALMAALGSSACERKAQQPPGTPQGPTKLLTIQGFKTPESVKYDPDLDVYFVSNINGNPSAKDDNGFITRVRPDGTVDSLAFVAGGRGGVTLHAPKGMVITGDTLWVADIDAVRGFNKRTGAPVAAVDLSKPGARFPNDIAVGPDGALYLTDTGIMIDAGGNISHPGPDRIFRIGAKRQVGVAAEGDTLDRPNGIAWDGANDRGRPGAAADRGRAEPGRHRARHQAQPGADPDLPGGPGGGVAAAGQVAPAQTAGGCDSFQPI